MVAVVPNLDGTIILNGPRIFGKNFRGNKNQWAIRYHKNHNIDEIG